MKKQLLFIALLAFSANLFAQSDVFSQDTRLNKTYLDSKRELDKTYQYELLQSESWQNFIQENGNWFAWFNEENGKPHRAYGQPIAVSGSTPESKAMNFITGKLSDFNIPVGDLRLSNVNKNEKMHYINYFQEYNGLKVMNSNLTIRLSNAGDVIMWGADVYNDISLATDPQLDANQAGVSAAFGITTPIENTVVKPGLVVLPIPDALHPKQNKYRLVYEVNVHITASNGIPANWYTLVDAVNGEILYRHNEVYTCGIKHNHSEVCLPGDKKTAKEKIEAKR